MNRRALLVIAGWLIIRFAYLWPQDINGLMNFMKFRYLTIEDGLSNNHITSICADKYGYIWIATQYGLNRFNGIRVETYHHILGENLSLISDYVNVIFCDSRGKLWVGTNKGLCFYNEFVNGFSRLSGKEHQLSYQAIFDIKEDKDKKLWIGTENGLFIYVPETGNFIHISKSGNNNLIKLPSDSVYKIMFDRVGNAWIALFNKGLHCINDTKGTITSYYNIPGDKHSLSDNRVESIYQDKSGQIWAGTYNGGLNLYNNGNGFIRFIIDANQTYSNRIRTIFESNEGILLFGTRAGLYAYNSSERKFISLASSEHTIAALNSNSVICSYVDKHNGVWLGTYYGGVNYSNIEYKTFIVYMSQDNDIHFLNNPNVFAFNEDSYGNLYVCTEKGVNILYKNSNSFEYLMNNPKNPNSLKHNDTKSIIIDQKGNLWIGTNGGGLNYYSKLSRKFTFYLHNPDDSFSLPSDKIYTLLKDSHDTLWILSNKDWDRLPSRLSKMISTKGTFRNYPYDFYNGIIETKQNNLYIGGINGFWLLERNSGRFIHYPNNKISRVLTLYEDINGILWIGSDKGLARYDPQSGNYNYYSSAEGYPVHYVYGILGDNENNLWLSTNYGLIKFKGIIGSTDSVTFRLYNKDDGLPSSEFIAYNASFKSKTGELFFGTGNGFVRFFPKEIKDNSHKPFVVISALIIGDKIIYPHNKYHGRVILKKPIQATDSLILNYKARPITIKFDAIHYANPEKNIYKYRLTNFEKEWTYANAYENHVTYTSLPKGKYIFTLYAANNDGIYCDLPRLLYIRVLPPYWQTWGFRITVIFALLGIGYIYLRYRLNQLQIQRNNLINIVQEKTDLLNTSYNELKAHKNEIRSQNDKIIAQNEALKRQQNLIEKKNQQLQSANSNLQLLHEFGRQLTATLYKPEINKLIFKSIKSFFNVNIFGLGIFNKEKNGLVFSNFTEEGKELPEFVSRLDDNSSMSVYCFINDQLILCNDFENEYKNYISNLNIRTSIIPKSVIYLPLKTNNRKIGIITLQSYTKNAFSNDLIPTIESLASYVAIAIDNAEAYEIVSKQNEQLEKSKEYLEQLVKERTRDLEQAKNKAEESDRLKSAFLANMSHEIRTPLNAIVGFAGLLNESGNTPEEISKYKHIINKSSVNLLQLINDILDFSKIESGQLDLSYSDVNIYEVLKNIYISVSEEIKRYTSSEQQVGLRLILPGATKVVIKTDVLRFQQIFNNLLSNAVKFTPKGFIEFGIKEIREGEEIIFFVKDTGIGIDRKYHEKIFERFFKIEENKNTLYRGTGLGLAITKHLVVTLGGKIWVESEPQKGSTFIFTIPWHI
jgi:ligand-binding sensor domain-containing protein/signal transduction histidine kinase